MALLQADVGNHLLLTGQDYGGILPADAQWILIQLKTAFTTAVSDQG